MPSQLDIYLQTIPENEEFTVKGRYDTNLGRVRCKRIVIDNNRSVYIDCRNATIYPTGGSILNQACFEHSGKRTAQIHPRWIERRT